MGATILWNSLVLIIIHAVPVSLCIYKTALGSDIYYEIAEFREPQFFSKHLFWQENQGNILDWEVNLLKNYLSRTEEGGS